MMRRRHGLRILGCTLVGVALVGFLTVADDWRHVGELASVAAVLVSGLAFLAAASGRSRTLAFGWIPAGLSAGLLAGVVADRIAAATAVGFGAGILLGYARRTGKRKSPHDGARADSA